MKEELIKLLGGYLDHVRNANRKQWDDFVVVNKNGFWSGVTPPKTIEASLHGFLEWLEHAIEEKK